GPGSGAWGGGWGGAGRGAAGGGGLGRAPGWPTGPANLLKTLRALHLSEPAHGRQPTFVLVMALKCPFFWLLVAWRRPPLLRLNGDPLRATPMEVVYEMTTSMGVANSRQPRPMFHR